MELNVSYQFLPKTSSVRAAQVMDHFGIGFEQGEHVIAEGVHLPVKPGEIVLFTGESGSGKSSLMRALAAQLSGSGQRVLTLDACPNERRLLIDLIPLELQETLTLLGGCGLSEAQLMLRTPQELSDGQRYRFQMAWGFSQRPEWLVADEFTATLDRRLAKVIAFNLRKTASRSGTGVLLATTHEDFVEDLSPDWHVKCELGGDIRIVSKPSPDNEDLEQAETSPESRKKKRSRSSTTCGSPQRPKPTGRISLGGITEVISLG